MDTGNNSGLTVRVMKVSGKIIEHMAKANSLISTETYTKVTGSMIRLMVMAFITTSMVLCTKASGEMTCSMEQAKKAGPMVPYMRESTWQVKSTE